MTNFEHLKNETRTFDGMLDTLNSIQSAGGCIIDVLSEQEFECPSDCTCRICIETWLCAYRTEE